MFQVPTWLANKIISPSMTDAGAATADTAAGINSDITMGVSDVDVITSSTHGVFIDGQTQR